LLAKSEIVPQPSQSIVTEADSVQSPSANLALHKTAEYEAEQQPRKIVRQSSSSHARKSGRRSEDQLNSGSQLQLVSSSVSSTLSPDAESKTHVNLTPNISVPEEVIQQLRKEINDLKTEVAMNKAEMNKTIQRIEDTSSQDIRALQEQLHEKEKEIVSLSDKMEGTSRAMRQNLAMLTKEQQQRREEAAAMNEEITKLKETMQHQTDDLAAAHQQIERLRQQEMELTQKADALSERLQQKDEQLATTNEETATLQQRFHQNEARLMQESAALTERIQAQEAQLQTFCTDAIQLMRRQIDTEVHRQIEQITQQMNIMQKLFNTVKPQWLITRQEVTLGQRELGNGGWGRVVEATFRGEQVAAKCLHNQIISDYNIQLFVREMQISSKCHHPNLLKFLGATLEGDPIILTELMQTNLYDVIRQQQLKDHHISTVLRDIASAINYLHGLSPEPIIHRDISSSNVLLRGPIGGKWVVKLSDFGSANFLWHTNEQSRAPGNPTYAAPEVLSPHSHSEKMDVYSFGVLMFEMCSGQAPSLQARNQLLPTAATVWPDPQCHYVPLIVACTRENKDDRPSMSQILDRL